MYTAIIKTYTIDLAQPARHRWAEVIENETEVAAALLAECIDVSEHPVLQVPSIIRRAIFSPLGLLYRAIGGRYQKEMRMWGDALELSAGEVTALNCIYELSPACTAGVVNTAHGPVHVRSLDWPLEQIGAATRLFQFVGGSHEFVAVGVVGHVGVFSGMVPGAYSVTINQAPSDGLSLAAGASFLLRHVLETCATYNEAVYALQTTPLAASVIYTICGAKAGQACVVERTCQDAAVLRMTQDVIVRANHFVAPKFQEWNEPADEFEESYERAYILKNALQRMRRSADPLTLGYCLDAPQVFNESTQQQMVFVPRTGQTKVWRYV